MSARSQFSAFNLGTVRHHSLWNMLGKIKISQSDSEDDEKIEDGKRKVRTAKN